MTTLDRMYAIDQNRDRAAEARREGRYFTHIHYGVHKSIAYGLDGLYGYRDAAEFKADLERGAAVFTPGIRPYVHPNDPTITETELRALWGDR